MTTAIIGFLGTVIGALVGAWFGASRTSMEQRVGLTLRMDEEYHALIEDRIHADRMLSELRTSEPTYESLYATLTAEEWARISRVRHFWSRIAVLMRLNRMDAAVARTLFAEEARFWWGSHFRWIEERRPSAFEHWRTTWSTLTPWLVPVRHHPGYPVPGDP